MEGKPIRIIRKDLEGKTNIFEQASFDIGAATIQSERPGKTKNEDSYFHTKSGLGIFDGVGGHLGGDIASGVASKFLFERVMEIETDPNKPIEDIKRELKIRIEQAHAHVRSAGKLSEEGPATTADVVIFRKDEMGLTRAVIGHVGDSRVYILKSSGHLSLITVDDSLAVLVLKSRYGLSEREIERIQDKVDGGGAPETEAERFYSKNRSVITDALGGPECKVKIYAPLVEDGDTLIAVTDGVSDNVDDADFVDSCGGNESGEKKSFKLTQLSLSKSREGSPRSKKDDMTAVIVNVKFNK